MLRNFLMMLLLTAIIILAMPFVHQGINGLAWIHKWFVESFGIIIKNGTWGLFVKQLITFILIPFIVGGICAIFYWIFKKRNHTPFIWHIMWLIWVVLIVAVVG